MRQKLCTLLLLLATTPALHAQDNLSNRWKETQRLDLNKKPVSYTDTMRLLDVSKESMNLRAGSFMYKGTISNDLLDFGHLTFGIVKNTKDEVRLRDEDYFHVFSREAKDMSAADAGAKKEAIDLPSKPVGNIELSLLAGTWQVYKRQGKNGPLAQVDYATLITGLTLPEQSTPGTIGTVSGGQRGGSLYVIKEAKGSDLVVTDKNQKEQLLKVWRLSAEELVIEDGYGIIYYLKHFR